MDLDLIHETLEWPESDISELVTLVNELEINQAHIEERFGLQLPESDISGLVTPVNELEINQAHMEERFGVPVEACSRARILERWKRFLTSAQRVNYSMEFITNGRDRNPTNGDAHVATNGRTNINMKSRKRKNPFLVARALDTDDKISAGFFDCKICSHEARDPVVTCCGHLFCWSCFYQLSYAYLDVKECPVCSGEVSDSSVIPIYGGGNRNDNQNSKSEGLDLTVPPRPVANRKESLRQQQTSLRFS